jgi:hypothetical protein
MPPRRARHHKKPCPPPSQHLILPSYTQNIRTPMSHTRSCQNIYISNTFPLILHKLYPLHATNHIRTPSVPAKCPRPGTRNYVLRLPIRSSLHRYHTGYKSTRALACATVIRYIPPASCIAPASPHTTLILVHTLYLGHSRH